jgi:hypothetical protein
VLASWVWLATLAIAALPDATPTAAATAIANRRPRKAGPRRRRVCASRRSGVLCVNGLGGDLALPELALLGMKLP